MKRIARMALACALLLGASGAAWCIFQTFPRESGRLRLAGLGHPVEVSRDAFGIPSIAARDTDDLFFAQGFVTAQDRLWQMEFQRRVGNGTLSEVLGERMISTDRFLRTLGIRQAAERAWSVLSPPARRALSRYASGVNACLKSTSLRPIEFRLLRFEPRPFDEIDFLTWSKMMAWDLGSRGGGIFDEIERAQLASRWEKRRVEEFFVTPSRLFPILSDDEWTTAPRTPVRSGELRDPILPFKGSSPSDGGPGSSGGTIGSNSWVVAGSRTSTGRPILANDPHLGLRTPSIWYLAELRAPGFHAVGATFPGMPGIAIGRNDHIAWGLTNIGPDVQDLYVETTDPAHPGAYLFRGEWKPFSMRREVIHVRGKPDVVIDVRESIHGPVISDVVAGAAALGASTTLRWTAIDPTISDRGLETFLELDRAANWTDFLSAVSLFIAPAQNFIYADVDGHIGYTASGTIPLRPRASGLFPVAGEGADEWSGFIPFAELPRCLDPAKGYLVTANNAVASSRYPYTISRDWPEPFRAERITERIVEKQQLSVEDVESIQLDQVSNQARELLPVLLNTKPRDGGSSEILSRLKDWNCRMAPDSVAAAMYAAWYAELSRLPEKRLGEIRVSVRTRFLIDVFSPGSPLSDWCDDPATARLETCDEFKSESLRLAARDLEERLGGNSSRWEWERLHTALFPHAVFDKVFLLRRFFSLASPAGGDASTVNVGAYRRDGSFAMTDGVSYRQIIDFSNLNASLFVQTTGESGNVFSAHYRDFLPLWSGGRYVRISAEQAVQSMRLDPVSK